MAFNVLSAPTKRFEVRAVLFSEDGSIVPLGRALEVLDSWYESYRRKWLRSEGMEAVGNGGLLIEVWGLVWFMAPRDAVLNSALYWLYAMKDLLRGAASANVAAWEESSMTASMRAGELTIEEIEQGSGFVFFPQRRFVAEKFFSQLLEESRLIARFASALLEKCEEDGSPRDFCRAVRRNMLDGFPEALGEFEREVTAWRREPPK